ncbi:hypothetical protein [Deinococcus sp.]|uniref:hypothetical protein n=1 Tax=Deinococcus sp. TaxID=47478 RepID=UPI0025E1C77C|nr:hypothetical protein [Deinococcus sp.]
MKLQKILLIIMSFVAVFSPALAQSKTPVTTSVSIVRAKVGPLGDLSAFRVILQDTLALVQSGKSKDAVTRIRAFELLWDKQANTLTSKDSAKWTTLDRAADVALRAVRSSPPSKTQSTTALQELIKLIDAG